MTVHNDSDVGGAYSRRTLLMSLSWADNMQRENLSRRTLNELRLGGQYAAGNLMSLSWADNMQRETPRRTFRREVVFYIRGEGYQTRGVQWGF